jgi:COP9 signalosome complex subunit 6
MMEYNENPLFLLLDASAVMAASQRELPLAVFESELRIINDAPRVLFSKLNYTIETNEAERIAVDHVAHLSTTSATNDGAACELCCAACVVLTCVCMCAATAHLASLQSAVLMLRTRLALLERYLQRQTAAAADSNAALDIAGLRRVNALTQALPALATDAFDRELAASFNDGALLAYLVSLTRVLDQTNSVIDRVNAQSESKQQQRPQHMGMLF